MHWNVVRDCNVNDNMRHVCEIELCHSQLLEDLSSDHPSTSVTFLFLLSYYVTAWGEGNAIAKGSSVSNLVLGACIFGIRR